MGAPPIYLTGRGRGWRTAGVVGDPQAFHRTLPDYAPTPLRDLPHVAGALGLGRVVVKDETDRLGLPAFKVLGASYAVHKIIEGGVPSGLVTATDGNHGRALARTGRLLGVPVRVHVPDGVHPAAIAAIEREGATVVPARADYDEAVRRAGADAAATGAILLQDTAWPGYERFPGWIADGYTTMFREIDTQLAASGDRPDAVLVPVGVGSLALAALTHYRATDRTDRPAVAAVEPDTAACVLASLRAGALTSVRTGRTVMAGLNCGTPSSTAWTAMRDGLDAAVAITDAACAAACRALAEAGIDAGPCGGATLAGLHTLLGGPQGDRARRTLGLDTGSTVVLLCTEGSAANPALIAPPETA
jgi:diaminopropionate ammonia-lyase